MKYKQDTYVGGKLKHTRTISAEHMVELLSRILVFKECGHEYAFAVKRDENFDVVKYTIDFSVVDRDPNERLVHQDFFPVQDGYEI